MEKPEYNKKVNLRLPLELHGKVEQLAHDLDRSINEQIVYMLRTWQNPSGLEERLARLETAVLSEAPKKAVGQ